MPFVDTSSHLMTTPCNLDIKYQDNSESYDQHFFFGPTLGVVRTLYLSWEVFVQHETILMVAGS